MSDGINYTGILVRASLEDNGKIPRSGPLQESPDTIPFGSVPVDDPQQLFKDSYDENVSKPLVADQKNVIYVRGKNGGDFAQAGEVYVYWANEDDLNNPTKWKQNQLLTTLGRASEDLPPIEEDEIAVTENPFEWSPDAELAGQSVAVIGVIATNERPNPVPGLRSPINFDRWISEQGGVGALQATVEAPPEPSPTLGTSGQYDLGNEAGTVTFRLRTKNIPIGSTVCFKAAKPDAEGRPIEVGSTRVTNNPFSVSIDVELYKNYSSQLEFKLFLPDAELADPDNEISVEVSQLPATSGGPSRPVVLGKYASQINVPVNKEG